MEFQGKTAIITGAAVGIGRAVALQLAKEGVSRPRNCKFTVTLDSVEVFNVIEVLPCTNQAVESINNVPEWRA
mgnify:CR=1 FL=1